jgi:hypothetical protein
MNRKVVIYGRTLERAILEMNKIHGDTTEFIIKRTQDVIETNSKIYKAVVAKESNRALKYHDAYVDLEISLRLYFNTIKYQMVNFEDVNGNKGFIKYF